MKKLLVIKFGTASITQSSGVPDPNIIDEIARQVSSLRDKFRIVIVSSGAVGAGKQYIRNYEGQISQKKAAAAIGNPLLLKLYADAFSIYGITVAQSLLERQHFAKREQFLQLKETYEALWASDVIPIANENDVVSNREIKFSDNDELATLIATGFGAERLMLCTASGGLLDQKNVLVKKVKEVNEEIMSLVKSSKTALGSGGMASKLTFTKLATQMGIKVSIFGMKVQDALLASFEEKAGTTFSPQKVKVSAKNAWMLSSGLSVGKIFVDSGAYKAILERKSLLAVGVKKVEGMFDRGELVEVLNENGQQIAIGKSKLKASDFESQVRPKSILIHADDLVLM
jgi:glutamate 5-kinase